MTEDSEKYRHKLRADSPRQIVGIIFCVLFANIAKDAGWLPYIPGFVLAFTVAYLADYRFPPMPPIRGCLKSPLQTVSAAARASLLSINRTIAA